MLHNYLTVALRTLRRQAGYTAINVVGLAVGLAVCLLIFLFVRDEQSYDRFHERADRIVRVVNERHAEDGGMAHRAFTPPAMGPALARTFPEVEAAVRFFALGKTLVQRDDLRLFERNVWLADSTVFDVFSIRLLRGDPATALTAPRSLVLSATTARRYFGDDDPLGQTLVLSGDEVFTVTGVMADWPRQSHLTVDLLGSFATMRDYVSEERLSNWIWQQFYTYLLLPEGYDPARLEARLPDLIAREADEQTRASGFWYVTHLQPMRAIYLRSAHLLFDAGPRGNIAHVVAFSAIAVLILGIACFNFMNLSTARSMQRMREVGLRKVIGARREQLIGQFLGESTLLVGIALVLALGLAALAMPAFNAFTGKALSLNHPALLAGMLGFGIVVGVLAGSYPALFLSSFRPMVVLRGKTAGPGPASSRVRRGLVVAQFAISMVLLVGAVGVYRQLDYLRHKDLGYNQEQVILLPIRGDVQANLDAVKAEVQRHPGVTAATATWGVLGEWVAGDGIRLPGREGEWPTNVMLVDHDFVETFQMDIVAGRNLSRDFSSDTSEAFLLNEAAAAALGWTPEEAVGQAIWWDEWGRDATKRGHVVGIVRNFHYRSLHQAVAPIVMHISTSSLSHVAVRITGGETTRDVLDHLEQVWATWAPAWPFEYEFLDADIADEYEVEQHLSRLVAVFAGLAILIACLGLFGLAAFTAEQRTREIGIRKVLGASVAGLVLLLTNTFTRLVALAFVIAVPVAYLALDGWLDGFAYRIDISWPIFLYAGLAALGVAVLSVGYQAVRAAVADPVRSLRSL